MTQRPTKDGDKQPSNSKRSGCTCSPSNKGEGCSKVSDKQVGRETTTLIGFSHPHPGIQTLWIPRPGPESRVACHSLTTLQSTKKMRNHRSGQERDTTMCNRSAGEEGTYRR